MGAFEQKSPRGFSKDNPASEKCFTYYSLLENQKLLSNLTLKNCLNKFFIFYNIIQLARTSLVYPKSAFSLVGHKIECAASLLAYKTFKKISRRLLKQAQCIVGQMACVDCINFLFLDIDAASLEQIFQKFCIISLHDSKEKCFSD